MRIQIASGRPTLPFSNSLLQVAAGGTTTQARTLYFALQGVNRLGGNYLSSIVGPVVIAAGQKLTITIPPNYKLAGEFWRYFAVAASTTNVPTTFSQLALIDAEVPESFVELLADEHFALNESVATAAALPAAPINGMLRGVTANSEVVEYRTEWGRWVQRARGFGSNITSLTNLNDFGCDREIRQVDFSAYPPPAYAADGSVGDPEYFWLLNDEPTPITSGQRVMVNVTVNGVARSDLFSGLLRMTFKGYANSITGTLRTAGLAQFPGVNESVLFENRKIDFFLPEDMASGEAYTLAISPSFTAAQLNNRIPAGAILEVLPFFAEQAGAYDESGEALGNRINGVYDRGVCVPIVGSAVKCLKRSGSVASRSFRAIGASIVTGFLANTADQEVRINGNGTVYRGELALTEAEAIRAIVDCLPGVSAPSPWSSTLLIVGSKSLDVTVTYPVTGATAAVRPDYPDALIAGNTQAALNALYVTIYVRQGGLIREFPNKLVVPGATQTFTLSDWADGTDIASPPAAPTLDFGLFEAVGATVVENSVGGFSGSVEVAFAYQYDGTTVSRISHSPLEGCLHTSTMTLSQLEAAARYWAGPMTDLASLRVLPLAEMVPWQTRRILDQGDPYYFDPNSFGVDGGGLSEKFVRPEHIALAFPGRWIRDETAVWYNGTGAPSGTIGSPGDYYIDDEGGIYRKTAPTAWTFQLQLQGTIWRTDSGEPTGAIGNPGDFYVQDSNGTYWRKTDATTWVLSGSIRVDWFDSTNDPGPSSGKVGDYHLNRNSGILFRKIGPTAWDQRAQLKGADGSQIFNTNGAPSGATGNDDDWAIDPTTGDLYLKAGGNWSAVGNIQGSQGSQGADGNALLQTSGLPSGATGNNGDWAIDPTTGDLYLKAIGSWTLVGNLMGPPGGGGGGGAPTPSETIYPFILLDDNAGSPYYSGLGTPSWRGFFWETNFDHVGLSVVDDQNNLYRLPFKGDANYWEKGQRLKVETINGSYNSVDDTYDFLIDPVAANYFRLDTDYATLAQRILLDPGASIEPGMNFVVAIEKNDVGTLTFGPEFKFAGGPLGPIPLTGYKTFAVTAIAFEYDFLCTLGADFE
jgi:hypothetical protein